MWFENLDAVRSFADENYQLAIVPRVLLPKFDTLSQHYEVRACRWGAAYSMDKFTFL